MPTWNQLSSEVHAIEKTGKGHTVPQHLTKKLKKYLDSVREIRSRDGEDVDVVLYMSGFLQKQGVNDELLIIAREDVNGLMSIFHGLKHEKLTLILHTPGGDVTATESVVEYIREMYPKFEVMVPTYAMSAGTMISLASDRVFMGKHSQLGPIDPQMFVDGRRVSARTILSQFERAKGDILDNPMLAHAWGAAVHRLRPGVIDDAQNALEYGQSMVERWLRHNMFRDAGNEAAVKAERVAAYFNDAMHHKNHGRRIGRKEAAKNGVVVDHLEDNQDLQDAVLSAYHVGTLLIQKTHATKIVSDHKGKQWIKTFVPHAQQQPQKTA